MISYFSCFTLKCFKIINIFNSSKVVNSFFILFYFIFVLKIIYCTFFRRTN
ncbi:hypothetical protein HanIR_Chr13g0618441 [Helianthus annuus]|nr:hypothetical protein HanIR_Chr13g0618441 [Helianthus annuus]